MNDFQLATIKDAISHYDIMIFPDLTNNGNFVIGQNVASHYQDAIGLLPHFRVNTHSWQFSDFNENHSITQAIENQIDEFFNLYPELEVKD